MVSAVWRATGLTLAHNKVIAIWSSESIQGMSLYLGILGSGETRSNEGSSRDGLVKTNVTDRVLILYGGTRDLRGQYFDNATGTLKVYVTLANRGRDSIRAPIKLQVDDLSSRLATISILNATNGFRGVGAIWDISDSLTGDQLPPGAATNPFCLSFHLQMPSEGVLPLAGVDLLSLRVRVFTYIGSTSEQEKSSKE